MKPENVLTQREWTEDELVEAGYRYYKRRRRVVLARELPPEEAAAFLRDTDPGLSFE